MRCDRLFVSCLVLVLLCSLSLPLFAHDCRSSHQFIPFGIEPPSHPPPHARICTLVGFVIKLEEMLNKEEEEAERYKAKRGEDGATKLNKTVGVISMKDAGSGTPTSKVRAGVGTTRLVQSARQRRRHHPRKRGSSSQRKVSIRKKLLYPVCPNRVGFDARARRQEEDQSGPE